MKREAGGDDGYMGSKRHRHGDEDVTFLIPSKVAGSIIGKGGSNISKLRSQYKASITVPDCPGPERILTISADLESILSLVREIIPNLEEHGAKTSNDELDIRMLIHQSQAGCVIGKAGAKIKELREKTGSRIKIFSNTAPQSTDRIVQIAGNADTCVEGVREILLLVKESPIKGIVEPYDPHNYDDFYAEEYGGFGGQGGGGPPGGRGGSGGGGRGRGPPMGRGPSGPPMGRGGPMSRGPPPMGRKFNGPPRGGFNDFGGPRNFDGPPPQRGGSFGGNFGGNRGGNFGGGSFDNGNPGPNHTSTQVTIPKDLAGAIIGKAGSRIRKIRADSGAGITIDEPLPGANDRIITISGDPAQIQMAQYLLQQSVHESNPNGGGRGGNF